MAEAETNLTWLPQREAVDGVASPRRYAAEHRQRRILRRARTHPIRIRTSEGAVLYLTGLAAIDWTAEFDFCLNDLIKASLWSASGVPEEPVERASLPPDQAIAYIIEGIPVEDGDWTTEMLRMMELGEIKLGEVIGDGRVPARGRSKPYGPVENIPASDLRSDMVRLSVIPLHPPKVAVRVDRTLRTFPREYQAHYKGPSWIVTEVDFARLKQAAPVSLRVSQGAESITPAEPPPESKEAPPAGTVAATEARIEGAEAPCGEAERYAAAVRAVLTKLNSLIAFDEANRIDWLRFVKLNAMIGSSDLVNLTPEESAAVRLVKNEFPFTVNAQLRRARDEMETIRRRIGDRFTEAGRAGGLVFKCRGGPDLQTVVTIPVTAELIWSWLRRGVLVSGGEHHVDVQIGPPELPEVTPESQHAVGSSGQRADQPSAVSSPSETASSPLVDAKTTEATPPKSEPVSSPADTVAAKAPQSTTGMGSETDRSPGGDRPPVESESASPARADAKATGAVEVAASTEAKPKVASVDADQPSLPKDSAITEPEVNRGGRPTNRDLIVEEAVRFLKENVPRERAPLVRQIQEWLEGHPNAHRNNKGEVASGSEDTITDHIRGVFQVATEAKRRLKAGEVIPPTLAGFVDELYAGTEGLPENAYRPSKDQIEELVRDRFNEFRSK
jgi:hypothetical protein